MGIHFSYRLNYRIQKSMKINLLINYKYIIHNCPSMGIAYVMITTRSPLWKLPLISSNADWILSKVQLTFMETVDLSGAITIFLAVSLVSNLVLKRWNLFLLILCTYLQMGFFRFPILGLQRMAEILGLPPYFSEHPLNLFLLG